MLLMHRSFGSRYAPCMCTFTSGSTSCPKITSLFSVACRHSTICPPPVSSLCLATGVDFESKSLRCREVFKGTEHDVDYDYLVIATGAQNNTFGVPGVNEVNRFVSRLSEIKQKPLPRKRNARRRQANSRGTYCNVSWIPYKQKTLDDVIPSGKQHPWLKKLLGNHVEDLAGGRYGRYLFCQPSPPVKQCIDNKNTCHNSRRKPSVFGVCVLCVCVCMCPLCVRWCFKENHVFFLKQLGDARNIRNRLLECFERAASPFISEAERSRLLSFVVVGGGPTSIE